LSTGSVSWAITASRLVALPLLVYSFCQKLTVASYVLFLFAVATDFLDGYFAKKHQTSSKLGAYFDVTADFLFVFFMFVVFVFDGFYNWWLPILVTTVFVQFILTSIYTKKTAYDPVGKYYGSLMFGGVGLTLLVPEQLMLSIVSVGVVVSTVAVLTSRLLYFVLKRKRG
jgi:phosphatidylglycerophosphate synthase